MLFPILKWIAIALAAAPVVLGIGWVIVGKIVLPRLIPRAEIDRLVEDIMRRRPDDPEEAAFIEEYAAWHRSQGQEQGKWRRVRKAIRRRLSSTGLDYDTVAPPLNSLAPVPGPVGDRPSSSLK